MIKKVSHEVNRASGGPRKRRSKGSKVSELDITSLVDILTILLLFLIQSVSVTAQSSAVAVGVDPPKTITTDELKKNGQTVVIIFKQNKIAVAGNSMEAMSFGDLFAQNQIAKTKRKGLFNFLQIQAGKISKRESNNVPLMLIQADKKTQCKYINNFIKYSALSGFADIYFATEEEPVNVFSQGGV